MKKMVIIGRGTAGAITAAHFNKHLSENWSIEWHYDPSIPTQTVGEGLNLSPPVNLHNSINFSHLDVVKVDGTFKSGIIKKNWGSTGEQFFHPFNPPSVAWHINAVKLQEYILSYLKNNNDRIKFVETNTVAKKIDADYIIDCSGRPTQEELEQNFILAEDIPVNSVHVTQCMWDYPRFQYSLTNAHEAGWYFGIPLQNRCAIGLMYNNNFHNLDQIKELAKKIIEENALIPSDKTNSFSFKNYYRKRNFEENIAYNGNASFFLEPLEATTIGQMVSINQFISMHLREKECVKMVSEPKTNMGDIDILNKLYEIELKGSLAMIMLHYFAGSVYKNDFWDFAVKNAESCILKSYENDAAFRNIIDATIRVSYTDYQRMPARFKNIFDLKSPRLIVTTAFGENNDFNLGTWSTSSWWTNVDGLGIRNKLKSLLHK